MNYKYDVSILLVNYNGKRYIENLFDSLCRLKHEGFSFEVIFEDNHSTDGSVEYLQEKKYNEKLNLKIVRSNENRGFAGGNNFAAKASEGKYLVLLNNDTKVKEDWLQELYQFMESHPDVAMANSKLLFFYDFIGIRFETKDKVFLSKDVLINGRHYQIENKYCKNVLYEESRIVCFGHSEISIPLLDGDGAYKMLLTFQEAGKQGDIVTLGKNAVAIENLECISAEFTEEQVKEDKYALIQNAGSGVNGTFDGYDIGSGEKDMGQYDEPYEINNGCGASVIMKKQDFDNCGGFDEKFFMYYEDTDLSYRIKKGGKKIMYCPSSVVRHIHTGSSTEWSPFFTYQVYRNKLLFVYKNISKREFIRYYKEHLRQGKTENNPYKIQGCKDCVKIIFGFRNVKFKG